jgi:hypothetical protein
MVECQLTMRKVSGSNPIENIAFSPDKICFTVTLDYISQTYALLSPEKNISNSNETKNLQ